MGKAWRGARLLVLAAAGAVGCSSGDEVLLGRADLVHDAGGDEDAGEQDAGAEEPAFDPKIIQTCDGPSAGRPQYEFYSRVSEPTCTKPCSLQFERMRMADDGSVWLAGGMGTSREHVWIGHYDADGAALGTALVPNQILAPLLAVDDQGQGWLLAADSAPGPSQLYRFDASLQQQDKRILPAGYYSDLIRYPGHGLLLSNQTLSVEARGYDGGQLWSTMDKGPGGRLAIDNEGQVILATADHFDALLFTRFASDGTRLADRTQDPLTVELGWLAGLTFDAHDGLTVTTTNTAVQEPTTNGRRSVTRVDHFDARGAVMWRWEFPPQSDAPAVVDPITGSTLVLVGGPSLVAISPNGRSCRRFDLPGPDWLAQLAVGPDGEIWVAGLEFPTNDIFSAFGRLERPDLRW